MGSFWLVALGHTLIVNRRTDFNTNRSCKLHGKINSQCAVIDYTQLIFWKQPCPRSRVFGQIFVERGNLHQLHRSIRYLQLANQRDFSEHYQHPVMTRSRAQLLFFHYRQSISARAYTTVEYLQYYTSYAFNAGSPFRHRHSRHNSSTCDQC